MFLSPSLSNGFGTGLLSSAFFPKDKGKRKVGRRGSGVGFGKGWERVKEGKREASGQYTRTRANFKAKHPKGGEKERREQNYWGTTFIFFFFLLFFFFGESSKARFLRDCATIRVSQVKSSQVRQEEEEEQGEQSERAGRGQRGRQGLSVRVRMFLCVCECTKVDLGREEDMLLCVCVCVYVQRGPSPHPQPQTFFVKIGFFARNYYRLVSLKLLMFILIF